MPRIDWSNPLTASLCAAYMPSATGGSLVPDLTGFNAPLKLASAATVGVCMEGQTVTGQAANTGSFGPLPRALKAASSVGCSLYWRGVFRGSQANAHPLLIGTVISLSGEIGPFIGAGISAENGGTLAATWGQGATFTQGTLTTIPSSGAMHSYAGTYAVGGSAIIYKDGVQVSSDAFGAGTLGGGYTGASDPGMCFGTYQPQPSRSPNVDGVIGLAFTSILSAEQIAQLDADPYQFFIYPEDDIFAELVGLSSVAGIPGGAWGESAWGRRAWGLPPLVTVVPNTNITLTSVSATSSKASFTPSVAAGFGASSSSGSVVGFGSQLNFGLSAATATGTAGSTTNKIDTPFAAVSSTSGVGTLTASSGTTVNLAGVSATSSIASFIGKVDGPLVSISSNAAVGNFAVTIGASLSSIIGTAAVANMIGTVAPPFAAASSSSGLGLFSASGGNVNFSLGSVSAIAVAGSFIFGNAANPWPLTRSLTRALTRALTRSLSRNL